MKLNYKLYGVIFVVLFANISAHKSIWPSCKGLANADKTVCIQFQYLQGSNRIAEFKKVCEFIFKSQSIETQKTYTSNICSIYDIEKMLGKPDELINGLDYIYYLNPNQTDCKAKINVVKSTQSASCIIYNCK